MAYQFSSAGLLYIYLSGYEEDGLIHLQQIDSYQYIDEGLYKKIMKSAELAGKNDNTVHVFAVVGSREKTDEVYSIVENELKSNFQRILSNKRIKVKTSTLDSVGNVFFRCVQEFFVCNPVIFQRGYTTILVI